MKRLQSREMALLCSPLLVVALAGWLLSKRPAPKPTVPLHLVFRVEKPTVLEAFSGADAALITDLEGMGADKMYIADGSPFLEVQTPSGLLRSDEMGGSSTLWKGVWKKKTNGTRFVINSRPIPTGKLRFGVNSVAQARGASLLAAPRSGLWTINRAQIKPLAFKRMPSAPLVRLSSVKIIQIKSNSSIRCEAVFNLTGRRMNAQTPLDSDFSERQGGMSWGAGASDLTPQTAKHRVFEWTVDKPFAANNSASMKQVAYVSGRVSVDNRWPLAFQIEPFDLAKVKVGQKLHFKSWPAPVPKQ